MKKKKKTKKERKQDVLREKKRLAKIAEEDEKKDLQEAKADEAAYQKSKNKGSDDHDEDDDDDDEELTDEDINDAYEEDDDYAANYDDKPKQDPKYWRNSAETTRFWNLINDEKIDELDAWITSDPNVIHIRSEDGRGPLFWAYEKNNNDIIDLLLNAGVDGTQKDADGNVPKDLRKK